MLDTHDGTFGCLTTMRCDAQRAAFNAALDNARQQPGPHVIEVPTDKDHGHAAARTLRTKAAEAGRATFIRAIS